MLREFVEQKHYKFAAEAPDWKEAIRMSCESLEADGTGRYCCLCGEIWSIYCAYAKHCHAPFSGGG